MTTKQQAIIKRWIKILRSGEYVQTTGELRNIKFGTFCVMGVLTDLAVKAGVVEEAALDTYDALPDTVQNWAGMRDDTGSLLVDPTYRDVYKPSLIELNDSGATFGELADIIEKQLRLASKGASQLFVKDKSKTKPKIQSKVKSKVKVTKVKTSTSKKGTLHQHKDLAIAEKNHVMTTAKA